MSVPGRSDITEAQHAISGHVRSTPVLPAHDLGLGANLEVFFKLEFLQVSGSFKGRGATHFAATQPISETGLVAASGGNHGAAVAWAAQRFGHDANIFVPTISAPAKVARLRAYGATVHQEGAVYAEALARATSFQETSGATSIHAYNDPVVLAGAGTCAAEFDWQVDGLDAVLLACGGGGLSAGAACWFGSHVEIVACETETTDAYRQAVHAGHPVDIDVAGVAADALGATSIGALPWAALDDVSATSAVVDDASVIAAVDELWATYRIVVEPSAAVPFAVLRSGAWQPAAGQRRVGVVLCGANTDPSRLA